MYAAINFQNGPSLVEIFTTEPRAIAELKQRAQDILNEGERPRNLTDWCVAEVTHDIEVVDVPFGDSYVKITPAKDGARADLEKEVAQLRALLTRIAELHVEEREDGKDAVTYAAAFGKAQGIALTAHNIATHVRKLDGKEQKQETAA